MVKATMEHSDEDQENLSIPHEHHVREETVEERTMSGGPNTAGSALLTAFLLPLT
jgi:hypothetical protein